ncbi:hypothetical protein ACLK19_02375 [Escherichia coli]
MGEQYAGCAGHRQLLADRIRLADYGDCSRSGRQADASGSPGVPMYGYNVQLLNEVTGEPCGVNEKGMLVVEGPLPPGCIQTIWRRRPLCEDLLVAVSPPGVRHL